MTILALYSNKGGVGKTAAAVNLAYLSAEAGNHTLICDLDPQGSATYYFRVKPKLKRGARGFVKFRAIERSIKGTDYPNLDLLPAEFAHRNLDITFNRQKGSQFRLTRILEPFKNEYDLIILDCLSTINILAENVFYAADGILTPLIPTTLSVRTFRQMLDFMEEIQCDSTNVYGFFSMVDRRKKMHHEFMQIVRDDYDQIITNIIPYLSVIEKMGETREPVPAFAPGSIATIEYRKLWHEVREKMLGSLYPKNELS